MMGVAELQSQRQRPGIDLLSSSGGPLALWGQGLLEVALLHVQARRRVLNHQVGVALCLLGALSELSCHPLSIAVDLETDGEFNLEYACLLLCLSHVLSCDVNCFWDGWHITEPTPPYCTGLLLDGTRRRGQP